jgi:hypothetical protein
MGTPRRAPARHLPPLRVVSLYEPLRMLTNDELAELSEVDPSAH